jgi:hypothetical protein
MHVHNDGTICKEGTQLVPDSFVPCCQMFDAHTATCEFDIRYEWRKTPRRWVIAISESAGGGGIEIAFCPHCGNRLPS